MFRRQRKSAPSNERIEGRVEFRRGSEEFMFVADETHQTFPVNEEQFPGLRAGKAFATIGDGKVVTLDQPRR